MVCRPLEGKCGVLVWLTGGSLVSKGVLTVGQLSSLLLYTV